MTLREDLQRTLGDSYTLERELGGGGMSRVFLAEERALGRRVVVKVLPPEVAAGVSSDRFKREIQMAARLQHPHIVPVLSSGEMGGVPFYTMPFVEGESVRARLQRGGALPMTEVIGILRDVAKALTYAHEHGVVHRDIKPDNVLLSGGSATVADFGIAKAIAAARADHDTGGLATLTQLGASLGTPAYMAPEQAAADPSTNHRADIYAFGCMAFELLAGRPPFTAKTPQRLLAAQMGETPEPIKSLRPDTPDALAQLVMRCLEKEADNRPQQAAQLVQVLETVTSGGGYSAMPAILLGGTGMLRKALAGYAGAFLAVALLAKAAIVAIGLPDWVFPGALVVMALGLPVILFTAYVHHVSRRVATQTPTFTPGGTPSASHGTMATLAIKASPHMSWRRTWVGGAYALVGFVVIVGGYMAMRTLGIGPAGSLFGAGTLQRNERLLVTDFSPPTTDTSLGPVVTDAFRTALSQSRDLVIMQPTQVAEVLQRMQRPANTNVDFSVGREIATREGIRAVVVGDVIGIGGSYALSVRLMSPQTGAELANLRETADSDRELLRAIDKLARDLRSRIGESLRDVQSTRAFEQVTTPSLEALKKYVQGSMALSLDGDFAKGSALLEQAIALDTGFAMAYRKLAVEYSNRGQADRAMALMQKAYDHRARLTDVERYYMLGSYYQNGPRQDVTKALEAYEAAAELQPNLVGALNNAANSYRFLRNWTKAEELYVRAIQSGDPPAVTFGNLVATQWNLGKPQEAWRTLAAYDSAYPTNAATRTVRAGLHFLEERYDSSEVILRGVLRDTPNNLPIRAAASAMLGDVAELRGRYREAGQWRDQLAATNVRRGLAQANLNRQLQTAFDRIWVMNDHAGGVAIMDRALAQTPLEKLPVAARPYGALVELYALAGEAEKARQVRASWERSRESVTQTGDGIFANSSQGLIALAERRHDDAIRSLRMADSGTCLTCTMEMVGYAFDLSGQSDSAIASFERYLHTPDWSHGVGRIANFKAGIHKRLGELYEARGDREAALGQYLSFVELWKNADPELQPRVAEVRRRIARLRDTEGR